ncbi:MAG TPA: hypothetical protein VFC76_08245, partial [Oscillospiraceae bacterium]|nr:hypothetical protein [Oscillospiraceae bacterium]
MKETKHKNKKGKFISTWIGVTFAVMLSLFIVLLFFINGAKNLFAKIIKNSSESPAVLTEFFTKPPETTNPET